MLPTHGRYEYSSITSRPDYTWPGGRRLAVYLALNIEAFGFGVGKGAAIAPPDQAQSHSVFSWRDYGNRVGIWRLKTMLEEFGLPVTLLVNSEIYETAPAIVAAFREAGHEVAAHGRTNSEAQGLLGEAGEANLIRGATETIAAHEGQKPRGWLGPWLSESPVTPDLLHEAGYEYLLDWCADDQPIWLKTRAGRILAMPYPQELNDSSSIVGRRVSASDFAGMVIDQFDEMLEQSAGQPLVYAVALHTYIMGQPFRLRHLRRALAHIAAHRDRIWLTHAGEIARHFKALDAG
jgi:allantoinase